jgi:hypothetical protein
LTATCADCVCAASGPLVPGGHVHACWRRAEGTAVRVHQVRGRGDIATAPSVTTWIVSLGVVVTDHARRGLVAGRMAAPASSWQLRHTVLTWAGGCGWCHLPHAQVYGPLLAVEGGVLEQARIDAAEKELKAKRKEVNLWKKKNERDLEKDVRLHAASPSHFSVDSVGGHSEHAGMSRDR